MKLIFAPFKWLFKLIKLSFYFCIFVVVLLLLSLLFIDSIVKFIINNSTDYVDLNAKVEQVDINLFTQRITLKDITLKNPDGFPDNDALKASQLTVKFDLFDFKCPVKRIYLRDATIRVEGRSGRRIMARSITQSNIYVIARELGRTFDMKLKQLLYSKKEKEPEKPFDYNTVRDFIKECEGIDELRVESLKIENGDDVYSFGSIICNDKYVITSNFKSTIFGVNWGIRGMYCDLSKPTFALSRFYIRNPEGFQKNNVFSIEKILVNTKEEYSVDGNSVPTISSIEIDSPMIYFEDKNGSMLGAIGMENNFMGLFNTVQSMTRFKLGDYFQDEFEVVPEKQEFKIPELKLEKLQIKNARLVSTKKDAGLLANKISFSKDKIDIDDIRAHIGNLKLELAGVELDSKKQSFTAKDFMLRNPAGFPEESAFRFKNFYMSTNFTERVIRGNRVLEVGDIEVNKFFVRLDSRSGDLIDLLGDDNNLVSVLETISATSAMMPINSENAEKNINQDKTKRPYRYTVKTVRMINGLILIGPKGDSIKIPFEDVIKENIGVEECGMTAQELTTDLLTDIIANSLDGAQSRVSEEIGGVLLAPIISLLRVIITTF